MTRTAVVTGASSGIGAATARRLAADGFTVVLAARREDRLAELADELGATYVVCDTTDATAVAELATAVGDTLDVLVNNAGGALGADPVAEASVADWKTMFDVNVIGTLQVTQALLPALVASGNGLLLNVTSTAAHEAYVGGSGYTVTKAGVSVLTRTLRQELLGQPVRVTELAPGMVATEEFGLRRFGGDQARRDATYAGVPGPLSAADVADTVGWIASLPWHVNIDLLVLKPRDQASQTQINRSQG
ncbi:SDR family NAD(P)-dependent oxidoreductase [Nocardioides sp.]|uniref:SDR family NAD(P)-dependent oxidoreductase n=1 Tax=Nocardioides sp. TaxID=35761 RepID=UPI003D14E51E